MSIVSTEPTITPEEFLAMPDQGRFELVDGQLVEVNLSALSSLVGGNVYYALRCHCEPNNLGYVWPADMYLRCYADPGKLRRPDGMFIARNRYSDDMLEDGYIAIPPDLVIEVVSPNDLVYDVDVKVQEYLDAGVRLVWIVNPATRAVRIHRADRTISGLREADELLGEDVVPGFRSPVAALFPARPVDPKK